MGRGSAESAEGSVAARGSARRVDPVVAEILTVLKGGAGDRHRDGDLKSHGLMTSVTVSNAYTRSSRDVPSELGKIMIEKGRLPTPTEVTRTAKRLDAELNELGVKGDVAAGTGFSYPLLSGPDGERLQRLMAERESIVAFERARAAGYFQALKITTKSGRAARDHLIAQLEQRLQGSGSSDYLQAELDVLRANGVVSVARAQQILDSAKPFVFNLDDAQKDAVETDFEAIAIGLGLPSTRERVAEEQEQVRAGLRALLDQVDKGESVYDDEIEWSARRVDNGRVKRAAFGYCEAAARIQADYHQAGIIELNDGTIERFTVKRHYSQLENHVDGVIESAAWEARRLKEAEELGIRAEKKLRSWARASA